MIYNINKQQVGTAYNISKNIIGTLYDIDKQVISDDPTPPTPVGFDWSNVKWVPMGDSISDLTEPYDGSESKPSTVKYQTYIGQLIPQMTIYNKSINNVKNFANGGNGFWKGSNNFYTLADYVPSDATIITLFGSVNDWHYREMPSQIYTNPLSKVNSQSEVDENGKVTWIQNPHLDTVADKTLAGYVADTLRKLHRNVPNAKVVVNVPVMYAIAGGANNTYMLNAYFCYQAVVQAMLDEEDAGDWLSMETWYFDAKLTRSVDGSGNVIYTRSATNIYVSDTLQLDLWLEDNLNGTFDSRKIKTMPAFGDAYCYDYRTDGESYGHFDNLYHQRYLAVKFAHTIINNLGGEESDLPQELRYNNPQ